MLSGIKKLFSISDDTAHEADIILTGIPRSGSTLMCKLLCEIPDVVALNEPMAGGLFSNRKKGLRSINKSFSTFRKTLLEKRTAPARTRDGVITDNAYDHITQGRRNRIIQRTEVRFDKPLSPDFRLIMKHCAAFSLLLPELVNRYTCYASVRNPLAVLGSWNSVNVPVSRGKVAKSERLLPSFHSQLKSIVDLHEKHLYILSWYFGRFDLLPSERIIRYEDIIRSNGQVLSSMAKQNWNAGKPLNNRNFNDLYDKSAMIKLAEKLLQSDGNYWKYYSRAEVEQLLKQYTSESK